MQSMGDAMAKYAERRAWRNKWGAGGDHSDLYILYRSLPGAPPRSPASKTQLLDGVWKGRWGEILMIRDGTCRLITNSYNLYEDGNIETRGAVMRIENLRTGDIREYTYAYKGKRMIMRDDQGNVLLYRRMKGPWPY